MGNNLDQIMTKKGKSSRGMAKELNIEPTSMWKMRNGKQKLDEYYIKLFCDYFGVSSDFLIDYDNPVAKEKPMVKEVPPTYYNILAGLELCSLAELEKIASIIDFLKHKKKVEAELPPGRKILWGDNPDLPKDRK